MADAIPLTDSQSLGTGTHLNEDGSERERRVFANNAERNLTFQYVGNHIVTSKYTVLTFLPKNLFEQFRRVANAYFLFLLILQLIPAIASLSYITTAIPLIFVLSVTGVKDGFDDFKRHKSDKTVNTRPTKVMRGDRFIEVEWKDVVVGDIIRMDNNEFVAADLLLLSSSEPHGLCYVETAELDGETNLKLRQSLPDTNHMDEEGHLNNFNGVVYCEPPNNNLHRFDGALVLNDKQLPIDNDKILLRGCVLRNTKWVHGMVIFAGHDTKLMQNSGGARFKRTQMDILMNILVISIFIFLASLCFICSIGSGVWVVRYGNDFTPYVPFDSFASKGGEIAALNFLSFLILLNTLVPISLYVSVEIIRLFQSWLIDWDREMYYAPNNTPAQARSTTLTEELGQIQYIFSDKTGTLTCNIMAFLKCSINGVKYGKGLTQANKGADVRSGSGGENSNSSEGTVNTPRSDFSWNRFADKKFEFCDDELINDVKSGSQPVAEFFKLLALCHTVMPEEDASGFIEYNAQSPDEAALVAAARNFGYVFKKRTPTTVTIECYGGKEETYELLTILEFNSDRKRMSTVFRCPDGKIRLFCKGADSVIYARLNAKESPQQLRETTSKHLEDFANDGLRTLCLSYRDLDADEFEQWRKDHHEASVALTDRENKLNAVAEHIEHDLILLGATAIEDKLQEGVPEAIANLARADIKIWVLTGDKQETAINIGFACRLLRTDMEVCVVNGKEESDTVAALDQVLRLATEHTDTDKALVIDGHSLHHALEDHVKLKFLEAASLCKAVICCRVSPLQKSLVVSLVKVHKKAVTLAIGDGANDVSMIQAAHIGIGISGLEGRQAVLASDYSFAQFRFLERLILVHGRWSYMRTCKFMSYFFYKNFAFTLVQFWYAFYSGFTAMTLYDTWIITFYNVIFTSLPVLGVGIFDQDVDDKTSLRYPMLYVAGQRSLLFNKKLFWISLLKGVYVSIILFFVPLGALHDLVAPNGLNNGDLIFFSSAIAIYLVLTVNIELALNISHWTVINHLFVWASMASVWLFMLIFYTPVSFGSLPISYYNVFYRLVASAPFWFTLFLSLAMVFIPVLFAKYYQITYQPTPVDIVKEIAKLNKHQENTDPTNIKSATFLGEARSGYAFSQEAGFGDLITPGPRCSITAEGNPIEYPRQSDPYGEQKLIDSKGKKPLETEF